MMPKVLDYKSILVRESKDSFLFGLATFIPLISGIILMPFFWQKLTPGDYGVIAVTEMIGVVVSIFLGLGLDSSLTRFYYEWNHAEKKQRIGTLWVANWLSIVLFGLLAIILFQKYSTYIFPKVDKEYIFIGLIAIILRNFANIPFALLRIKKMPKLYSILSIFRTFVQLGLGIYFVLILEEGLKGYLIANVYSAGIVAFCLMILMFFFAVPFFNFSYLKEAFRFSIPLIPSLLIRALAGVIEKYYLQKFVSLDAVGIYSQVLKFSSIISKLHSALKLSFVPFLYKYITYEGGSEIIMRMTKVYVMPLFLAAAGISLCIDEFVLFINKAEYFSIISYVPFMVVAVLIGCMQVYYAQGISLAKRNELFIIPSSINLFVVILGGYFLINAFELEGAVLLRLFSVTTLLLVTYILSKRVYKMKYDFVSVLLMFFSLIVVIGIEILFITEFIYSLMLFLIFSAITIKIVFGRTKDDIA